MKVLEKYNNLSEKNKIIIKNVFGAFVIKGLSLFLALFTMPAYIRFFNDEATLGLWFTVLAVLQWILNFDLGIGNGLRNYLSLTLAQGENEEAKKYISSAYISVGILSVVCIGIFMLVNRFINWHTVFNIDTKIVSSEALETTVVIVVIGIILQLFFKLISSVLYAMQKSSINNLLALCTSVITVVSVSVFPSYTNDKNIINMAIIHALAVLIPLVFVTIVVFSMKSMKTVTPKIQSYSRRHAQNVLTLGGEFFFVQIVYMIIMNTNEYLITFFVGSKYVVEYQIYYKLFTIGSMLFTLALTPVWSTVTKAIAENDLLWIKKLYKKMIQLAMLGTVCEFLIIPFLQIGVNIWLGEEAIEMNYMYGIVFAMMGSIMIFNSVISSIANGVGKLRTQSVCFGLGALLKIPLACLFIFLFESWIGVVLANISAMVLYCIVQPIWLKCFLRDEKSGV